VNLQNRHPLGYRVWMIKTHTEAIQKMDASTQFCPNLECKSSGKIGQGNIVVHQRNRERYKCKTCGRTFSARRGTALEGIRKPEEQFIIVITLLAYGCPIQAIVQAYGLDERTVADWRDRAGIHCQKVHQYKVEQGNIDVVHVQADEIRVKARGAILWIGLAIMVKTRLWIAGTVSFTRDSILADHLMQQVYNCCKKFCALLICTDGWSAYPNSIKRIFCEEQKELEIAGIPKKVIWPDLHIGTVIKCMVKKRLKEVIKQVTYGSEKAIQKLINISKGGSMINTSYIERLNGTMRERLASLTRRSRYASHKGKAFHTGMYLVGCVYNFCTPHHELSKPEDLGGFGRLYTPAMATDLTSHIWSVKELLTYKNIQFLLPVSKEEYGSPSEQEFDQYIRKKPVLRLLKGVLVSTG
jgi:transposase-like protein/IS1 family transposase